ncbi:uncharacterized protein [Watersipora subatra]|uniref:uncharacterized protein n=1 Tax=Watersipora subatra TaxID=2589382 RepID=UPI00355B3AF1
MSSLKPPAELDFSSSQKAWPDWRKRFERYRSASGLCERSAQRQVDTLIFAMGEEAEAIADQIQIRPPREADEAAGIEAENAEETLYLRTLEGFDNYFNPRSNHLHYAVLFGSRLQLAGETNEQFIRNLHELASKCSWNDDQRNDMMRTRLLAGMRDKALARDLQINPDVTLEEIKQQLRTKEIILENQKAEIDGDKAVLTTHVRFHKRTSHHSHAKTQSHPTTSGRNSTTINRHSNNPQYIHGCKYCGSSHDRGRCPAYGKECMNCKRRGHFAKVCKSKQQGSIASSHKKRVNELSVASKESLCDGDVSETFYVHAVDSPTNHARPVSTNQSDNKWLINVKVHGKPIDVQVDTGAQVSVMPKQMFLELGLTRVVRTGATLVGFSGRAIPVVGKAELSVEIPENVLSTETTFYITETRDTTLLGLPAVRALGLIPSIAKIAQASKLDAIAISDMVSEFPAVFEGLGCFEKPAKLELKQTAEPKAVPPRQVPHHMRQK